MVSMFTVFPTARDVPSINTVINLIYTTSTTSGNRDTVRWKFIFSSSTCTLTEHVKPLTGKGVSLLSSQSLW